MDRFYLNVIKSNMIFIERKLGFIYVIAANNSGNMKKIFVDTSSSFCELFFLSLFLPFSV
jgi:hypothetical protein